jgi:hypothetical protein
MFLRDSTRSRRPPWYGILVAVDRDPAALTSQIPSSHPYKRDIELVCDRLLDEWGAGWYISISAIERGQVSVAVGRRGSMTAMRNAVVRHTNQTPNFIERWLRQTVATLNKEANLQFGMIPVGQVPENSATELIDLVGLYGGRLHPDGWITLPNDKGWPGLMDQAQRLGITLAASVR